MSFECSVELMFVNKDLLQGGRGGGGAGLPLINQVKSPTEV